MSKKPIIKNDYIMMPINYVEQLQENDRRDKARAFMEYYLDMENEDPHSFEFYSNSWNISTCTAIYWIKDFHNEIDKVFSKSLIDCQEHYKIASMEDVDFKVTRERL